MADHLAPRILSDYLRDVAIARLALDNVQNHRTVRRTMGFPVATQALRSGADDVCGTGSINAINACIEAAGKDLPDPTQALIRRFANASKMRASPQRFEIPTTIFSPIIMGIGKSQTRAGSVGVEFSDSGTGWRSKGD